MTKKILFIAICLLGNLYASAQNKLTIQPKFPTGLKFIHHTTLTTIDSTTSNKSTIQSSKDAICEYLILSRKDALTEIKVKPFLTESQKKNYIKKDDINFVRKLAELQLKGLKFKMTNSGVIHSIDYSELEKIVKEYNPEINEQQLSLSKTMHRQSSSCSSDMFSFALQLYPKKPIAVGNAWKTIIKQGLNSAFVNYEIDAKLLDVKNGVGRIQFQSVAISADQEEAQSTQQGILEVNVNDGFLQKFHLETISKQPTTSIETQEKMPDGTWKITQQRDDFTWTKTIYELQGEKL